MKNGGKWQKMGMCYTMFIFDTKNYYNQDFFAEYKIKKLNVKGM